MLQSASTKLDNVGTIEAIFIAKKEASPMESVKRATLIAGVGIDGDRYATRKGTYSANFLSEPGRNLTMVSADAFEQAMEGRQEAPPLPMTVLRRNVVIRGLDAEAINDMVGHEVSLGCCRLFVHRRTVPCKYREAESKCNNFMNNYWDVCGVSCEILVGGEIAFGDVLSVIPKTHKPQRCRVGLKPPGFFEKPADRTLQQVKGSIIPVPLAIVFCLLDPDGFERAERGYNSVGQHFWSPRAYKAGLLVKEYRTPLLVSAGIAFVSVAISWVPQWMAGRKR